MYYYAAASSALECQRQSRVLTCEIRPYFTQNISVRERLRKQFPNIRIEETLARQSMRSADISDSTGIPRCARCLH
ncbi:unnamed protein product [Ranitomeya imitator]|uniref:Uncharacterized protein n=1 Tax=Ranitomeya imitator TaxID=111125 RepID=A0ABN9LBH9_9NEOB|nr:unnamed protein product [Ranitomeya imitator]